MPRQVLALVVGGEHDQVPVGRQRHIAALSIGPHEQACPAKCGIAERFELLADLLELEGAVVYRVLAYRRAAKRSATRRSRSRGCPQQGRLTELPGVG